MFTVQNLQFHFSPSPCVRSNRFSGRAGELFTVHINYTGRAPACQGRRSRASSLSRGRLNLRRVGWGDAARCAHHGLGQEAETHSGGLLVQ